MLPSVVPLGPVKERGSSPNHAGIRHTGTLAPGLVDWPVGQKIKFARKADPPRAPEQSSGVSGPMHSSRQSPRRSSPFGPKIVRFLRINAVRNTRRDFRKLASKDANSAPPGPAASLICRFHCRDFAIHLGRALCLGSYRECRESHGCSRLRRSGQRDLVLRKVLAVGIHLLAP